jgi:hypothetical protein
MKRAVFIALVLLAACAHSSSQKDATQLPLQPPVAANLDNGCARATSAAPDQIGSVHTVPPRASRAIYEVAIAPAVVCPGGTIRVAVRVTNPTRKTLTVTPSLIITRPSNNLACCGALTVKAHGSKTITRSVVIPTTTPIGSHQIRFRDYLAGNPEADRVAILFVKQP